MTKRKISRRSARQCKLRRKSKTLKMTMRRMVKIPYIACHFENAIRDVRPTRTVWRAGGDVNKVGLKGQIQTFKFTEIMNDPRPSSVSKKSTPVSASTVMILSFQDSLIPTSRYFIFGWHSQYNYSEILTGRVDFFSSSGRPRYTLKDAYNYSIVTCLTGILSGRSGAVIFVVLAELLEIDERWKKVPKVIKVLMRSWKWENWCRVRQKFLKTQW